MNMIHKLIKVGGHFLSANYFGFVQGHQELSPEQVKSVADILENDQDENIIRQYEQRFAALIGQGYGKSFLTGRMAFYTLLKVLNIGPGDEVILPAFTCAVMPNAIWRRGATPIFADIDLATFGSDPDEIKKKITVRIRMIVAQHSFGIPCRIEEIVKTAKERSIFLMEDSALTVDSSREGIKVGNWGDAAILDRPYQTFEYTGRRFFLYPYTGFVSKATGNVNRYAVIRSSASAPAL